MPFEIKVSSIFFFVSGLGLFFGALTIHWVGAEALIAFKIFFFVGLILYALKK